MVITAEILQKATTTLLMFMLNIALVRDNLAGFEVSNPKCVQVENSLSSLQTNFNYNIAKSG